jgi:hypothetical protein
VEVDGRRVARSLTGAFVAVLAAVVVVLFIAGAHKNAEIMGLRRNGVPVDVTVSSCRGLLGGSGSNGAGYSCRGAFVLDAKRYNVAIPGATLHAPGTTVPLVTIKSDPGLVATVEQVKSDHASWTVFVLPTVLLVVLAALLALSAIRHRRDPEGARSAGPPPGAGLRRGQPLLR